MLTSFLSGTVAFGFVLAALFFIRFWRDTRDELFFSFGIAFLLLGLDQAMQMLGGIPVEQRSWVFLIRLWAFALILMAIARKNQR